MSKPLVSLPGVLGSPSICASRLVVVEVPADEGKRKEGGFGLGTLGWALSSLPAGFFRSLPLFLPMSEDEAASGRLSRFVVLGGEYSSDLFSGEVYSCLVCGGGKERKSK